MRHRPSSHSAAPWAILIALTVASTARALEIGDQAPPLELEGLLQAPDGVELTWEALQGTAVVLEFWSTGCGPCVSAIPHLNKLAETIREEGEAVQFIAITHEEREVAEAFLGEKPIQGWIGLDTDRSVIDAYDVHGVPSTILVDKDGRIAGIAPPMNLWMVHLRRLAWGRDLELPEIVEVVFAPPGLDVGEEGEIFERFLFRETLYPDSVSIGTAPGKVTALNSSALRLVAWAHGFPTTRVEWKGEVPGGRYDLVAALPGDELGFQSMVRENLAAEFGISTRLETRSVPVAVLKLGRRAEHRLVSSGSTGSTSSILGAYRTEITNGSMEVLAAALESRLDRPVIDDTGLEGSFDIELPWDYTFPRAIIGELRSRCGLVLASARRDVELLIIE